MKESEANIHERFLVSPQALNCLLLKVIPMPKWHILGRPVLNPLSIPQCDEKNKAKEVCNATPCFVERSQLRDGGVLYMRGHC